MTKVQIDPSVILKIVEENPNCVMLKHEDWPGLDKISALRAASASGARRISILCGNGGIFLTEESFHENTTPPSSGRWATVICFRLM